MTHRYALIGRTLTHSFSQSYFASHYPHVDYGLCPMNGLEALRTWAEDYDGFNVTTPYKVAILDHLDELTAEARQVGAVNCVRVLRRQGASTRLVGHNTDAGAFQATLTDALRAVPLAPPYRALVLGTGGAARAVAVALRRCSIPSTLLSHTQLTTLRSHPCGLNGLLPQGQEDARLIVINATPVGMAPLTDMSPLPGLALTGLRNLAFVYDLIYNPSPTRLLAQAAALDIAHCDGLAMLHLQADLSYLFWTHDHR